MCWLSIASCKDRTIGSGKHSNICCCNYFSRVFNIYKIDEAVAQSISGSETRWSACLLFIWVEKELRHQRNILPRSCSTNNMNMTYQILCTWLPRFFPKNNWLVQLKPFTTYRCILMHLEQMTFGNNVFNTI